MWLEQYLSGRDQQVDLGSVLSEAMPNSCGILYQRGNTLSTATYLLFELQLYDDSGHPRCMCVCVCVCVCVSFLICSG